LFSEFDRLGVLDIELFADDTRFEHRARPRPDPNVRRRFDERTQQAEMLAQKALAINPRDVNSLLAQTLVCGLRSDYAALIDKNDLMALRWSKEASRFAQRALQAKPDLYDAHLATGIENYMLSLKPAPVRWMIRMTGGATDQQTGLRELRLVAEHGYLLAPFARLMLAVAELREGNKQQARTLLAGLANEFPNNNLYRRQMNRIQFGGR
jgi:tetratricopeptide (TPR) repeat protein